MEKRTIAVLLTKYNSTFSNFIYWLTGRGYTHASISFDENSQYYYSFNFKGFRREYPGKHKGFCSKSVCYWIEISEDAYNRMTEQITEMEKNRESLHYTRLGVLFCLLRFPVKIKNAYFCSQFVAEMLQIPGVVPTEKSPSLCLPNHLAHILDQSVYVRKVMYNAV